MIRTTEVPTLGWTPLLEGAPRREALLLLDLIEQGLAGDPRPLGQDLSLAQGTAGKALFFGALHAADLGDPQGEALLRHAQALLDGLDGVPSPHLYRGLAGAAWVLDHLQHTVLDGEDLNGPIDAALARTFQHTPPDCSYALVDGWVGWGVYALGRADLGAGEGLLADVVHRLDADHLGEGRIPFTAPGLLGGATFASAPEGCIDLGMAHGLAGVLAFAGRCAARGLPEAGRWVPTLAGFLLAHWKDRLPKLVKPCGECLPAASPLAWCYGDLGAVLALLGAARATGAEGLEQAALDRGEALCALSVAGSPNVSAGLCHGLAGTAHLFNRLYQATGRDSFRREALRGFQRLCQRFSEAWGPYDLRAGDPGAGGFLEGMSGIGLALLAALSPKEPSWDEPLLVKPLGAPLLR